MRASVRVRCVFLKNFSMTSFQKAISLEHQGYVRLK